ncbi:MAG TPA: hypothetical protein VNZ61_15760 [Roseomonas sp.]|nr:hypothetical protein [Roseomonas sp.]
MSELWKNPAVPGLPNVVPGSGPRSSSPLADYNRARFTGYGGTDVHRELAELPPSLNPIVARLRAELERLVETYADFFARHAEMDPRALTRTKEGWAVTWRRWALNDLSDKAVEVRDTFVIHRGDSFEHRLFLDRQGKQLLAVQPQNPLSHLRYKRLSGTTDLCDLYGPFARLADTPLG